MKHSVPKLPKSLQVEFRRGAWTDAAGLGYLAPLAQRWGLPEHLQQAVQVKKRRRGASDSETLLSLIMCLCTGNGHLSDLDRLRCDPGAQKLLGGWKIPDSRRAGEYLRRLGEAEIEGLQSVARRMSARVLPKVVQAQKERHGYVPILLDGSAIEISGKHVEGANNPSFLKQDHLWLHAVFAGDACISGRLHPSGVHPAFGWREQLEADAFHALKGPPVWLRADNAYYGQGLVACCQQSGWDYSVSVTNEHYKRPILARMQEVEDERREGPGWQELGGDGLEQATYVKYRPTHWDQEATYVVTRKYEPGPQKQLYPGYGVILVSRDDLDIRKVVERHRGKQGHENVFKGLLRELDLHHPPCRTLKANQAYYALAQLAQLLLIGAKYELLPKEAHGVGLRRLIRHWIRCAGRVVRRGRRWVLQLSETVWRRHWHACASRLVFDGQ